MSKQVCVATLMPGDVFRTSLTERDGMIMRYGTESAESVVVQFTDDDEETQLHSDVLVIVN